MKFLVVLVLSAIGCAVISASNPPELNNKGKINMLRTHSLEINVSDMDAALNFYVEKLGFEVSSDKKNKAKVILKTDDRVRFVLTKVKKLRIQLENETFTGLSLQVNDLDEAIENMKKKGVPFAGDRRKVGVGESIYIRDPFGRKISLLHQTIVKTDPFKEPKIYNFGVTVPDMKIGRAFYSEKLGFVVRSERYLPAALPLGHADNSFGFMLHSREGIVPIVSGDPNESAYYTIVFETENLKFTHDLLKKAGVKIVGKSKRKNGQPERMLIEDPFGNISAIVQRAG